ncbi:MAG: flavodoxin-dependent (E)-4-hydroxy-3-methylbut-2-enyl-diphosphate synthase, partial [Clostridia bacterium]|nr:flavodoxin-dependent (E)-4-hydroxy-3-methylbut-2-enyl-diphosphate synthase [Clostridia bacterium]
GLAQRVTERVRSVQKRLKVAVMGCVVNGPGEARGCDLGLAGGKDYCVIIQKDRPDERVSAKDAECVFFERLEGLLK